MHGRFALLILPLMIAPCLSMAATLDDCDRRVRMEPESGDSYHCYVQAARASGRLQEAAARLEAILEDDPGRSLARLSLAALEADQGLEGAESNYRQAIEGLEESEDAWGIVYARSGLAALLIGRQRYDEARTQIDRAVEVASASGDPIMLAHARTREAYLASSRQDYGEALRIYRQAEAAVFPDGPFELKEWILSGMGMIAWGLGRYGEALEIYQRGAEMMEQAGNLFSEATWRYNVALLAGYQRGEGKRGEAELRRLVREAIAAAQRGGNRSAEGQSRLILVQTLGGEEALRELRAARKLFDPRGEAWAHLFADRMEAFLTFTLGPDHEAEGLARIDDAIRRARELGDSFSEARGLASRAAMLAHGGRDRREVAEAYLQAEAAAERIRDLQPESSIRARSFTPWIYIYKRAVDFLLRDLESAPDPEGDLELAFRMLQRMRARTLLDTLDVTGVSAKKAAGPLHRKRELLLERISGVQAELMDTEMAPSKRAELLDRLDRLESEEVVLRDSIARRDPAFARREAAESPSLAGVQELLAPDQALLTFVLHGDEEELFTEFFTQGGSSWLIAITPGGARAYQLPPESALMDRVPVYLGLLQRRDEVEREASRRLYDDLLAAAIEDLPEEARRLVIVTDGVLGELPFAALRMPSEEFLAERFQISFAPSSTLWVRWQGGRPEESGPGAVLGLAAPGRTGGTGASGRRGAPWLSGLHLGPLPHAAREAENMFRRLGGEGRFLEGALATEDALKGGDLSRYDVLHLAAHAVVDQRNPGRSAIVLAGGEGREGDDGLLQFREIVDLDLDGDLVILSACQSAGGERLPGEGILSLARAFFEAGARTVVGSLLPLRDDETAVLMDGFSRELARGRSVEAALAASRREMIRSGAPPAAWAGMIVLGDGNHVPRPRHADSIQFALPVAIGLLLMAFITVRWSLRRSRRHP